MYQRGRFPPTPWACLSARSVVFYHGRCFSPNFKVGADDSRNWIHSLYLVEASSFLVIVSYPCPLSLGDPRCLKHFSTGHNTVTLTLEHLRKLWGPSRPLSPTAFHSIAVTFLLSQKKRQRRGRKGQGVSCSLAHLFPGTPPLSLWGKSLLSHTGGCFFMTFLARLTESNLKGALYIADFHTFSEWLGEK